MLSFTSQITMASPLFGFRASKHFIYELYGCVELESTAESRAKECDLIDKVLLLSHKRFESQIKSVYIMQTFFQ